MPAFERPARFVAASLLLLVTFAACGAPAARALTQPVSGLLSVGDDASNAGQATVTGSADVAVVMTGTGAELVFAGSRFAAGTVAIVYHELPGGVPDDTSWIGIAFSLVGTAPGSLATGGPELGFSFDLTGLVLSLDEGLMDDVEGLARDFVRQPLDFALPPTFVFVALDDLAAPRFTLPLQAQANVSGWGTMVISGSVVVPEPHPAILLGVAGVLGTFLGCRRARSEIR